MLQLLREGDLSSSSPTSSPRSSASTSSRSSPGRFWFASGTTAPWYDTEVSLITYSVYLVTYLIILIAVAVLGATLRPARGPKPSLTILIGPAIVAALYVGLASMLLPGAGGFLQANFRLNTAAILAMGYSWFGLAFYFAAAVSQVLQQKRGSAAPEPQAHPSAKSSTNSERPSARGSVTGPTCSWNPRVPQLLGVGGRPFGAKDGNRRTNRLFSIVLSRYAK